MRQTHEITYVGSLQEILAEGNRSYTFRSDDVNIVIASPDKVPIVGTVVSKYKNAKISVTIEFDEHDAEYEGLKI